MIPKSGCTSSCEGVFKNRDSGDLGNLLSEISPGDFDGQASTFGNHPFKVVSRVLALESVGMTTRNAASWTMPRPTESESLRCRA